MVAGRGNVGALALLISGSVSGATIEVDSLLDGALGALAGNGNCELREAIQAAETGTAVDACVAGTDAGADTIVFAGALAYGTLELAAGSDGFVVTEPLTITGPVSGQPTGLVVDMAADAADARRFAAVTGGSLSLSGLVLRNGYAAVTGDVDDAHGGAVHAAEGVSLAATDVAFLGNTAPDNGGAIYNNGTLTFDRVRVSGNEAVDHRGGGIYNARRGDATIHQSSLTGNRAARNRGGALFNDRTATVALEQVTISGNVSDWGAGVHADPDGTVTLRQSTVTANAANIDGGGVFIEGGASVELYNTAIVGNTNGDCSGGGSPTVSSSVCGGLPGAFDPLADYGGGVLSHLIAEGADGDALLDAGSAALIPDDPATGLPYEVDQRGVGFDRVLGSEPDLGAVEGRSDGNEAPTATADTPAVDVTASAYQFRVVYADNTRVDRSTLVGDPEDLSTASDHLRVTAPDDEAFSLSDAELAVVSVTPVDAQRVAVDYAFAPAGGSWQPADAGVYEIAVEPGVVTDFGDPPLSVPGGPIGTFSPVFPEAGIADITLDEGDVGQSAAVFTVTLSDPAPEPFTLAVRTADGTATVGDGDYAAVDGTLAFNAGDTSGSVPVAVNGDGQPEADEVFTLTFSGGPDWLRVDRATAAASILDDDNQPPEATDPGVAVSTGGSIVAPLAASDPEGGALTYTLGDGPEHGSASIDGDGRFHYLADEGFTGTDQFSVSTCDPLDTCSQVTITVSVAQPAAVPLNGPAALLGLWAALLAIGGYAVRNGPPAPRRR